MVSPSYPWIPNHIWKIHICKLPFKVKELNCYITFAVTFTNEKDHLASQVVLQGCVGLGGHGPPGRGDLGVYSSCQTLTPAQTLEFGGILCCEHSISQPCKINKLQGKAGGYILSRKQRNRALDSFHSAQCLHAAVQWASGSLLLCFPACPSECLQMDSQPWR